MKADRDDAPEWLTSRPRKRSRMGVVVAGVIGTVVTLGALNVAGQALMQNTFKDLVESRQQPIPVAEITRAESTPKDWDRIVEEQARRDAMPQQLEVLSSSEAPAIKQTVFNDLNYIPRGADNVLSLRESYQPAEPEKSTEKLRGTVIKEDQRLKDLICGRKEGSIERRNCRSRVGLNHRN